MNRCLTIVQAVLLYTSSPSWRHGDITSHNITLFFFFALFFSSMDEMVVANLIFLMFFFYPAKRSPSFVAFCGRRIWKMKVKVGELEQTIGIFRVFCFYLEFFKNEMASVNERKKFPKLDGSDLKCRIEMRYYLFFRWFSAARLVNIIQMEFIIVISLRQI